MKSFQINSNEAGQRFDKYLKKLLSAATESFIYKMLRKKNITLNEKKADGCEKLTVGDEVKVFLSDETFEKFSVKRERKLLPLSERYPYMPMEIIHEDEDIIIVNKPSGILSQKAAKGDVSANEYIIGYLLKSGVVTEETLSTFHPSICNRLDRNTSGLLLAGKSLKGLQTLCRQLDDRTIEKYYRCLVKGHLEQPQVLEGWLLKDELNNKVSILEDEVLESKYIKTAYTPITFYGEYTLLEVHLITGRSHQIRAHLASIGHPIVGDAKYGDKKVNVLFAKNIRLHTQLLHAYRMKLEDGRTFTAPLSREFQQAIQFLKKQMAADKEKSDTPQT